MGQAPFRVSRLPFPMLAVLCSLGVPSAVATAQNASQPVTQPTGTATGGSAANSAGRDGRSAHLAEVRYAGGLLTVTAHDASLNEVLRQIAQQTGMRISGGVRDDRVFGTYGPEAPSAVLSTLLDGSGSNMLLVNNTASQPAQLILTPRTGGPTPANEFVGSRAQQPDQDSNEPGLPQSRFGAQIFGAQGGPPPGIRVGNGPDTPANQNLNPSLTPPTANNSDSQAVAFPPISATTTPATATTSSDVTQETPSGVKTPQQIFEQLQKMRQQQEQTQPTDGTEQ